MKILAVFAHPDDESFGPGGTLSRYATSGDEVHLVTMTRGEAGSLGISKFLPEKELANRRTAELECAAGKLHIQKLNIYDLPDKKLKELPDEAGMEIIREHLKDFSPDIVITFHTNGISGHPDHQTVSRWTFQAVREMENAPRLLFFGVSPQQSASVRHREIQAMREEEITHIIDVSEFLPAKIEAIHCHVTQEELWNQFNQLEADYADFSRLEHFSQVWPPPNGAPIRNDLF